ncbi:TIR domain-containing protein [Plantactinospora sp. S1510]|uniref:TIR domain-containing protein n=1 Tax=Plantactinospora alkalitolerans TaxID=2789879 RepID=A0ABS0GPV9_9ACTN|nr:TIR-like protein FxsC [Plantactinospora alkalitolerans]MBF9128049.1 TIR domain-containing protein [Plantactinospora alkalitolerans]
MTAPQQPGGPRRLHFFLSYARSDDDPYVERFYKDLCAEVRVRAGLASGSEVGFFDKTSIEIGATWSADLVDALSTACSFLALFSPRYFASEPCGREWQLFAERVRQHEETNETRSAALLPVLWLPPRQIPDAVQDVQYDRDVFSDAYRRDGLRQLMRLRRNEDEYIEAISILADRIVDNAASNALEPLPNNPRIDFHGLRSAFHGTAGTSPPPADEPRLRPRSDHVHFVIAAPSQQEASTIRQDLHFYGAAPLDWAPYLPALPESLASFARAVAARRGLSSDVSSLPLPPGADTSPGGDSIVVLLVDAWVTQLDDYRQALAEQEIQQAPATAAMIPRNHEDHETHQNWRRLSDGLRSVMLHRVASGEPLAYRADILTHRSFDEDLQVVLEVARNRVFARAAAPDTETSTPRRTRPILEGP